ncbi:hypothetical protein MPSEU_000756000 [Mayamaea pseudoterrestris]|nr:hypothetical protein MPSEU_000756000 [Mayamaea pseudoterrestris]
MTRFVCLAVLLAASCRAFAPLHASFRISPSSALNLLPHEGSQLVAASRTAYSTSSKSEDDQDHASLDTPTAIAPSKAQAFVARVFSLPASIRHPHSPEAETDDGVLYPIVGFCLVKGGKALPTTSNPACRIPPRDEELYGWFRAPLKSVKP